MRSCSAPHKGDAVRDRNLDIFRRRRGDLQLGQIGAIGRVDIVLLIGIARIHAALGARLLRSKLDHLQLSFLRSRTGR